MEIQKEQIKDTLEKKGFILNSYNEENAVFQKENMQIDVIDLKCNTYKPRFITDKDFIQEPNEEEVLSVIESFLNRLKSEDWGFYDRTGEFFQGNLKELIILDKSKFRIIKEMIKDFSKYKI